MSHSLPPSYRNKKAVKVVLRITSIIFISTSKRLELHVLPTRLASTGTAACTAAITSTVSALRSLTRTQLDRRRDEQVPRAADYCSHSLFAFTEVLKAYSKGRLSLEPTTTCYVILMYEHEGCVVHERRSSRKLWFPFN